MSHSGYLKRTPISTYRQQRRGGTGRLGMKTREEDFVSQLIVDSTHAYLLCFTNTGRVYWLKVYEVPDVGAAGKGKSMASLLNLQPGETVRTILAQRNLEEEGKFVFFATQKGTVKRTPLKDFSNVMARGIIAIGIDTDDELIGARITSGDEIVFLATHDGMAIRFHETDVRSMGRPAYGVRGIDLAKGDYVVGLAVTPKERKKNGNGGDCACLILSVTTQGFGKRTDVDEYRLQTRGGKGVINLKTTARNGKVNAIQLVDESSELMVISQYGKIIRIDTKTIRAAGRSTQGVKLLNLEDGGQGGSRSRHPAGRSKDRAGKRKSAAITRCGSLKVGTDEASLRGGLIHLTLGLIAPVSLNEDPPASTLDPMRRNPHRTRPRRTDPIARRPHIAASIPALIAATPHPSRMRRPAIVLHNRRRRANTDSDLSVCAARCERRCK